MDVCYHENECKNPTKKETVFNTLIGVQTSQYERGVGLFMWSVPVIMMGCIFVDLVCYWVNKVHITSRLCHPL